MSTQGSQVIASVCAFQAVLEVHPTLPLLLKHSLSVSKVSRPLKRCTRLLQCHASLVRPAFSAAKVIWKHKYQYFSVEAYARVLRVAARQQQCRMLHTFHMLRGLQARRTLLAHLTRSASF